MKPHSINEICVALFEVSSQFESIFTSCQFCFYLSKWVAEDGKKHVEKDKEHEENKTEEVYWTEDNVGLFQFRKVKVPQDGSDEGEDGVVEAAVVKYLSAKEKVSKLYKGSKDDEKHDEEADQVSPASSQCSAQLSHCLDTRQTNMLRSNYYKS